MHRVMRCAASSFRIAGRSLKLGLPVMLSIACVFSGDRGDGGRRPDLLRGCEKLDPPSDQVVSFHGYAQGVQVYRWDAPTKVWVFVEPDATLYASKSFQGQIATHYAGPTWESDSGSVVVGKKLESATPDTTAIPWLLLNAVSSHGPGPLDGTNYIQRTNTTGGLPPSSPGSAPDEIAKVPYTAEYYFYRQR